jgi:alkanesulfonate monooxygenase SsuD/methylene tetrahydromethanopterin reductase-like flavin-dependent oxidoreductase (luciferase family)
MRLGYFAMPLHPPGADPANTMDHDLEQLATLDRLGYEEAWIGEHFTAQWENIPCPDMMLAQRIAQLDQMARGRFYWGVGSGGFPGDFEMFGVDPKSGEHRAITRHSRHGAGPLRGFDMLKVDPAMHDRDVTLEYLCEHLWIVGNPDTVTRKLAALSEEVGGFGTLLVIAHEWTPRGAWERSMRLLKEKVVPRLARTRSRL